MKIKEKVLKKVIENHKFNRELSWEEEIGIIGMELIDQTLAEVVKVIDENKVRGCVVFGKFKSNDWVVENPCPNENKNTYCDVCKDGEIYLLDYNELKQKLGGEE